MIQQTGKRLVNPANPAGTYGWLASSCMTVVLNRKDGRAILTIERIAMQTTKDREELLLSVRRVAAHRIARKLVPALHELEKQVNRIRHTIATEHGIRAAEKCDASKAFADHFIDAAFQMDCLNSLPIDYMQEICDADGHDELLGDEELIVDELKRDVVNLIARLAGTNEAP